MHARSSLLQLAAFPRGGLTPAEAPLIDAEILFRQPQPPNSDHTESAPQLVCCVVAVVHAHIIDQILMHKGLRCSLQNGERTRRSRNQYPRGGYVSQTKGLLRRFYLPIRAWPAADRGGLVGPPAHGIFICQATLNPVLACG